MLFRIALLLAGFISIFQVWRTSKLPAIFEKPQLLPADYTAFTEDFKTLTLLLGLLLVLSVFASSPKVVNKPSGAPWAFSFVLTLGLVATLIAWVNPTGLFPWNEKDSYVIVAARAIKPNLYAKRQQTPSIILLGSSVSFTTPADAFKKKWGVNAFNMSLNSGGPLDFVVMMHYIIEHSPDGKVPSTVLVEIVNPGLGINRTNPASVKVIPSLPAEMRFAATSEVADSLLQLTPFSAAIFTRLFFDTGRWKIWIKFADDGTGVRNGADETPAVYRETVKTNITIMQNAITCNQLNAEGKTYIENLIRLSHQYQFSLVFYRAPINDDFYKLSQTKPGKYAACAQKLDQYMLGLTSKNKNVFYKNLSAYAPISTGGMPLYMDTHHLKKPGAILLVEALSPQIEAALQWAHINRK